MRPSRRPIAVSIVAALIVLAAVLLSACGGDDGKVVSTTTTTTNAAPAPKQVVVQTASGDFNPAEIYKRAAPGVVTVLSVFSGGNSTIGGASAGQGSGFVVNKDGEIVTNAHVVSEGEGSDLTKADQVYVEFADRNRVSAEVLGVDPFADVALLKIDPDGLDIQPLELGDDVTLPVGAPVAAIGSPFSEVQSLTVGIVSAKDRSVKSLTQFKIENSIQTDAAINPGNSGGPLLDSEARVVGINQQIETRSDTSSGVGFAVPISAIKRSIAQLRSNGETNYAYIGLSSQALYPQLADKLGLDTDYGGLIAKVVPGGPADDAGLRGSDDRMRFQATPVETGGDVVLSVDGKKIVAPSDLSNFILQHSSGDKVDLDILRDGDHQTISVTLGTRPNSGSP